MISAITFSSEVQSIVLYVVYRSLSDAHLPQNHKISSPTLISLFFSRTCKQNRSSSGQNERNIQFMDLIPYESVVQRRSLDRDRLLLSGESCLLLGGDGLRFLLGDLLLLLRFVRPGDGLLLLLDDGLPLLLSTNCIHFYHRHTT